MNMISSQPGYIAATLMCCSRQLCVCVHACMCTYVCMYVCVCVFTRSIVYSLLICLCLNHKCLHWQWIHKQPLTPTHIRQYATLMSPNKATQLSVPLPSLVWDEWRGDHWFLVNWAESPSPASLSHYISISAGGWFGVTLPVISNYI